MISRCAIRSRAGMARRSASSRWPVPPRCRRLTPSTAFSASGPPRRRTYSFFPGPQPGHQLRRHGEHARLQHEHEGDQRRAPDRSQLEHQQHPDHRSAAKFAEAAAGSLRACASRLQFSYSVAAVHESGDCTHRHEPRQRPYAFADAASRRLLRLRTAGDINKRNNYGNGSYWYSDAVTGFGATLVDVNQTMPTGVANPEFFNLPAGRLGSAFPNYDYKAAHLAVGYVKDWRWLSLNSAPWVESIATPPSPSAKSACCRLMRTRVSGDSTTQLVSRLLPHVFRSARPSGAADGGPISVVNPQTDRSRP